MRKIVIVAGLLMVAALLTGSPAKADIGCECIKLGAAPVCTATLGECLKNGGVCLAPCAYTPPKVAKRHGKKKK
jgi:hypothetical protein